jgi:hypothetical protein
MTRPVRIPVGSWPLEMTAAYAAGFCGEPSVDAFLEKVRQRIYPAPRRARGESDKWHRHKLEHAIARRHGLNTTAATYDEDAVGLLT